MTEGWVPTAMPTAAPTPLPTEPELKLNACEEATCHANRILQLSKVSLSNLGGAGPQQNDTEAMLFDNVFPLSGHNVVLKVESSKPYHAKDVTRNSLFGVNVGRINFMTGTEFTFTFTFMDEDMVEWPAPFSFQFSVGDIDLNSKFVEHVISVQPLPYRRFVLDPHALVKVDDVGRFTAEAESQGDSPTDFMHLTPAQKRQAVTFLFPANTSTFAFSIHAEETSTKAGGGRNFFFGGPSNLICNPSCPTQV